MNRSYQEFDFTAGTWRMLAMVGQRITVDIFCHGHEEKPPVAFSLRLPHVHDARELGGRDWFGQCDRLQGPN